MFLTCSVHSLSRDAEEELTDYIRYTMCDVVWRSLVSYLSLSRDRVCVIDIFLALSSIVLVLAFVHVNIILEVLEVKLDLKRNGLPF